MRIKEKFSLAIGKKILLPSRREEHEADLVYEIHRTRELLEEAYDRFNMENDEMMLDSIIYEIQSLRAKYRFLLKLARDSGAQCDDIAVFS